MNSLPECATQELQSRSEIADNDCETPEQHSIGSRTRAAWKFVRPAVDRTTSFALTFFIVMMVLWELDDVLGGAIYEWAGIVRMNLLKRFPIVPLLIGMFAYHKFRQSSGRGGTSAK